MKRNLATGFGPERAAASARVAPRWRQRAAALGLAGALHLLQLNRAHGENYAGYRYESYKEDDGRIRIETQAFSFQQRLRPWVDVKGEVVYDAISGATPTGAPPPSQLNILNLDGTPAAGPFSTKVPVSSMHDIRWAGGLEPTFSFGSHRITPGFSYSEEHDYVSYGAALNYAVDLNEKNTTLNVGWSHNWDKVYNDSRRLGIKGHKDSDDFLIGVNQLLSPKTVLTANFTFGNARGYLADPYKGMVFDAYPQYYDPSDPSSPNPAYFDEKRPRHRERYIGYVSLTQYITPLQASLEGSYRFYHDSYGITAHTLGLTWYQKIGKHVTVAPLFRYYRQSGADFYRTQMPGWPWDPTTPPYYSADYRLSELESFTCGVSVNVKVTDWLTIDAAYKRYVMQGLDSITSSSAYPSAHIVTIGARLWF